MTEQKPTYTATKHGPRCLCIPCSDERERAWRDWLTDIGLARVFAEQAQGEPLTPEQLDAVVTGVTQHHLVMNGMVTL